MGAKLINESWKYKNEYKQDVQFGENDSNLERLRDFNPFQCCECICFILCSLCPNAVEFELLNDCVVRNWSCCATSNPFSNMLHSAKSKSIDEDHRLDLSSLKTSLAVSSYSSKSPQKFQFSSSRLLEKVMQSSSAFAKPSYRSLAPSFGLESINRAPSVPAEKEPISTGEDEDTPSDRRYNGEKEFTGVNFALQELCGLNLRRSAVWVNRFLHSYRRKTC